MEEILTEDDLRPLAECWTRDGLKEWLQQNAVPFVVAKSGWPRVHRKALEHAMGVKSDWLSTPEPVVEFNFDALR
jgi:hypothetical protein